MIFQKESSTTYNDSSIAPAYRAIQRLQELERGNWREETPDEKIERLENKIVTLSRTCERKYDFLIGIIEERTLVLSSVDEMYDDYC